MELYTYNLSVQYSYGSPTTIYSEPLPLPLLLQEIADFNAKLNDKQYPVLECSIQSFPSIKVKLKQSVKELFGNLAPDLLPISDVSIDEFTGKFLYHHFIYHDGKWHKGSLAEIAIEDIVYYGQDAKWLSIVEGFNESVS